MILTDKMQSSLMASNANVKQNLKQKCVCLYNVGWISSEMQCTQTKLFLFGEKKKTKNIYKHGLGTLALASLSQSRQLQAD